ncbi:MAG: flagellar hook-associated protein FlgK, partial [Chitinophagaceae bacterium]|nr:flagellar hook-associated protein FlgK [Rubrivivax sp.]
MSASPLMSLGIKAMTANYAALQTTGHNIANANVAGYSRQQVELNTAQGQFSGAGFFGKGVNVQTITRSHNAFLTSEAAGAVSLAAMDDARLTQLSRLESVFKTGEAGIGHAVTQFIGSMGLLADQPADLATRQVVLARAAELSSRFNEAGTALDDIQNGVTSEVRSSVAAVNSLAQSIAQANQKIAGLRGLGQPANDLLDERDRLISELSQHVKVSRIEADDGTVGLFIGGGQRLVLGSEAGQLAVQPDPTDPRRVAVGIQAGNRVNPMDGTTLGGGLSGLLRFQNIDLVEGRNLVGRLAATVGGAVNQQQQRGLNLLGTDPTPALFDLGQPQAIGNRNNARDAGGVRGSVHVSFGSDPAALRASEYDLREDPAVPGNWKLTRLVGGELSQDPADGLSFAGTTASFQGINIDFTVPTVPVPPQPGDKFLLQTVGRAANDIKTRLRDPRDLAAAASQVATTAAGNSGTAAVSSMTVTDSPLPYPGATTRFTFANNPAYDPAVDPQLFPTDPRTQPVAYTWEVLDSTQNVLASDATPRALFPGQPLPQGGADINGFTLTLSGVPRPGDR